MRGNVYCCCPPSYFVPVHAAILYSSFWLFKSLAPNAFSEGRLVCSVGPCHVFLGTFDTAASQRIPIFCVTFYTFWTIWVYFVTCSTPFPMTIWDIQSLKRTPLMSCADRGDAVSTLYRFCSRSRYCSCYCSSEGEKLSRPWALSDAPITFSL